MRSDERSSRDADRAALVGLAAGPATRDAAEHSLEELAGLADAVGAEVHLTLIQERPRPDPATFLGSGKLDTLRLACDESDVNIVVFDNELTPAQLRNLEKRLDRRVIDRTQLILDIFARRARTREGKLQVELAQLKYLLPRLVGAGAALSRLGGGIGTRGPGETKLETDRRRLRDRIASISRDIAGVKAHRDHLREQATAGCVAHGRPGGVHERGQDDAVQPPDACRRRGLRRALRDARSPRAPGAVARGADVHGL